MADVNIPDLPAASSSQSTDLFEIYDTVSGTNKKLSKSQLSTGTGNLNVIGGWDASTNTPTLVSSTGTAWNAYVVTTGGTTALDGVKSWYVGDVLWFNGENNQWERIANTNYQYPIAIAGYFDGATGAAFDTQGQSVGTLTSGVGVPWHAYGVGNPGNYSLDGATDWVIGEAALFNGITNTWFKAPFMNLNGRTGTQLTFPAVESLIMFGSSDTWVDQDASLKYEKATKTLVSGNPNNTWDATTSQNTFLNSDLINVTGTSVGTLASSSAQSTVSDSTGSTALSFTSGTISNSQYTSGISSNNVTLDSNANVTAIDCNSSNINNAGLTTAISLDGSTVSNGAGTTGLSLITAGTQLGASAIQYSLVAAGDSNVTDTAINSLIALGSNGTSDNVAASTVLPGQFNLYQNLTNCIVGGGFSNTFKNATESIDIGGAGGNSDLSLTRWHVRVGGTDVTNTKIQFTAINCDSINNQGDNCSYWGTRLITNSTSKQNAAAFGYGNPGIPFDLPYDNQAHFFFDSVVIGPYARHAGNTGLVYTSEAGSVETTDFPLSTYVTSITDNYIRFANTNAGASLTYVLPIEADLSDGHRVYCKDVTGNMGAAATAQSGTGKQINGAGTYSIHSVNGYWQFVWVASINGWDATKLV